MEKISCHEIQKASEKVQFENKKLETAFKNVHAEYLSVFPVYSEQADTAETTTRLKVEGSTSIEKGSKPIAV